MKTIFGAKRRPRPKDTLEDPLLPRKRGRPRTKLFKIKLPKKRGKPFSTDPEVIARRKHRYKPGEKHREVGRPRTKEPKPKRPKGRPPSEKPPKPDPKLYRYDGKLRIRNVYFIKTQDPDMKQTVEQYYMQNGRNKVQTAKKFNMSTGTLNKILCNPPGVCGHRPKGL